MRMIGMRRPRNLKNRKGAATVEFAFSAPLLFAIIFALIEMSRLFQLSSTITTAAILGAREASISTSQAADIESEVRRTLKKVGISEAQIAISPGQLTPLVNNVTLRIEVPLNSNNGFLLTEFVRNRNLAREVTVER